MAKLHDDTRKLDIPTSIGTFCLRRNGARTGSLATNISTRIKITKDTMERVKGMMTVAFDHYKQWNQRQLH